MKFRMTPNKEYDEAIKTTQKLSERGENMEYKIYELSEYKSGYTTWVYFECELGKGKVLIDCPKEETDIKAHVDSRIQDEIARMQRYNDMNQMMEGTMVD